MLERWIYCFRAKTLYFHSASATVNISGYHWIVKGAYVIDIIPFRFSDHKKQYPSCFMVWIPYSNTGYVASLILKTEIDSTCTVERSLMDTPGSNTCYGWVCLTTPWCYGLTSLLLIQFTHKETCLLWVWRSRQWVTQNLMTALICRRSPLAYRNYIFNLTSAGSCPVCTPI